MALTKEKLEQLLSGGKIPMNLFQFALDSNGHLLLEYSSLSPPMSITADGHLIFTLQEE